VLREIEFLSTKFADRLGW